LNHLSACEVTAGVYHIRDAMGVFTTLLVGGERALLMDTGYGIENLLSFVHTITDKPLTVLLTHAHHDHALGARCFEKVYLFAEDHEAYRYYTDLPMRTSVMNQALSNHISLPDDFLTAPIPSPLALHEGPMDLGGLTADIRLCPGHTPGSAVVFIPERRLLLTGDNWNPCTWLFFPEALPAEEYRSNMLALMDLPFDHVLCSHREPLWPRSALEDYLNGLTDDALRAARPVDMNRPIDTREAVPAPGQQLIFDYSKTSLRSKERRT